MQCDFHIKKFGNRADENPCYMPSSISLEVLFKIASSGAQQGDTSIIESGGKGLKKD